MDYIKKRSKSINSYSYSPQLSNKSAINVLPSDQMIKLNSKRSSCCRVIILQKNRTGSYGFTLQTYAFKHHKTERAELLTYVDFVEVGGPAFRGGMKRGDVIMSINDKSIEGLQHEQLVQFIKQSPSPLRLTVTNEDWCTRIDLNLKKLKLKQRLKEKYLELNRLERLEKELLRKAGLWCQKEASNECCSSDLSTSDPLSPFSSKRASFMCTSVDVLRDAGLVCNPNRDASGEAAEDLFRKSLLTRSDCNKMEKQHGRSYESHSLPIVRKKKHFLQNQVFSVCENVVKMGCFSRSSVDVDSSSVDDVALVCDFDCKTAPERDSSRTNLREQSKTWYGVPEMHRAALLKKQRKTSEASTKWYFSVFDDEDFAAPSKSGFDSSTSKSLDSVEGGTRSERNQIVESLPNRSFVPAKSTDESSLEVLPLSTPALECNHLQVGEDFERRRLRSTRSSEEARSSCSIPASNAGAFEDLSFESQEFMNSLPSTCSPAPDEDDRRRCLQEIRSRLDACRSIKTQLSLHESSDCDTHL